MRSSGSAVSVKNVTRTLLRSGDGAPDDDQTKAEGRLMQVSVIIAAFNAGHFIGRAISSVQKQAVRDLEIIVVDDASTDNTYNVVRNLAEKDRRINIIRRTLNTGPSGARNVGFAAAKGEWIAVLDADDAFALDRLERLITAGNSTDADVVVDNLQLYDEGAGRVVEHTSFFQEKIRDLTLELFFRKDGPPNALPIGWVKPIIRRSAFERTQLKYNPDCRYGEDFLFLTEMLLHGCRAICVCDAGYLYTLRHGHVSGLPSTISRTTPEASSLKRMTEFLLRQYGHVMTPSVKMALLDRLDRLTMAKTFAAMKDVIRHKRLDSALIIGVKHPRVLMCVLSWLYTKAKTSVLSPK
jgi:succinoglycan biosynthesis protein ExoO